MNDQACVMPHPEREPALDGLLLCRRHRRRMDDDVSEIGLLIVDTQRITDGGAPQDSGPRGGKSKKRADPPAPGDVAIMALYDRRNATSRLPGDESEPVPAVLAVVASWTLLLAEERPLTATLPRSVLAQLDLLRRHHEWIAAQLYIDDYLLEMGELRKALTGCVRDRTFIKVGTCDLPADDRLCGGALMMKNGEDTVTCRECGAAWSDPRERARLAWRM
jgi:hypothetical protein